MLVSWLTKHDLQKIIFFLKTSFIERNYIKHRFIRHMMKQDNMLVQVLALVPLTNKKSNKNA